jgi:hypothetical protein
MTQTIGSAKSAKKEMKTPKIKPTYFSYFSRFFIPCAFFALPPSEIKQFQL